MATNNESNKSHNDIEEERERRQEQASQQPRDEMGRFEEGGEDSEQRVEESVHDRPTSRMDVPEEEAQIGAHVGASQGRRPKQLSPDDDAGASPDERDEADEQDESDERDERDELDDERGGAGAQVSRGRGAPRERDGEDRGDGGSASSEPSERDQERGRVEASQPARSKQSINASKRPRDRHGRFQSANRKKRDDADSRGGSGGANE